MLDWHLNPKGAARPRRSHYTASVMPVSRASDASREVPSKGNGWGWRTPEKSIRNKEEFPDAGALFFLLSLTNVKIQFVDRSISDATAKGGVPFRTVYTLGFFLRAVAMTAMADYLFVSIRVARNLHRTDYAEGRSFSDGIYSLLLVCI